MTAGGEVAPSGHGGADQTRLGTRLEQLNDLADVALVEFNINGFATFVTPGWRRLTGCDDPLPIDTGRMLEIIDADDQQRVMNRYIDAMDSGEPFEDLTRFVLADGASRTVLGRTDPIRDGATLTGFVTHWVDITNTLEGGPGERGESYEALHRQSPVGQVLATTDGVIVDVNETFTDLIGHDRDDLVGTSMWELYHPDDVTGAMEHITRLRDRITPRVGEDIRVIRGDNTIAWITNAANLIRDATDADELINMVFVDVTDRHLTREALAESEERYRTVVDTLQEGIVIVDAQGRVEAVNSGALQILGLPRESFVGDMRFPGEWHLVDAEGERIRFRDLPHMHTFTTGQPVGDTIVGFGRPNRRRVWVRVRSRPLREGPDARGVVISFDDVTFQKEAEDRLRDSEEQYRRLVDEAPIGLLVTDLEGRVTHVNQSLVDIVGYPLEELAGEAPWEKLLVDGLPGEADRFGQLLAGEIGWFDVELHVRRADGTPIWCRGIISAVHDAQGQPQQVQVIVEDVTHRHEAEAALAASEYRYRTTVDSLNEGVLAFRGDDVLMNARAEELMGLTEHELRTNPQAGDTLDPRDENGAPIPWHERPPMVASVRGEVVTDKLIQITRRDGTPKWLLSSAVPIFNEAGDPEGAVNAFTDVTEKVERDRNLEYQATHDSLTDLPNRALLLELVDHALARAGREQGLVALLFLDLDNFKRVNDNHGHHAGDELLSQVAGRIGEVLRPSDTVSRVGGDEFVVVCEEVRDEHEAVAIAQRITGALESHQFDVGGSQLPITSSIGIAVSRADETHSEALLRDADAAMYRAKDHGRARHELFDEAMRRRSTRRIELSEELALAIERREVTVYYQPIVDLRTGRVLGVEALARWEHPTRGTLSPAEFIGLAEETGLIVGLGLSVLSQACEHARQWLLDLGDSAPRVHVNLSPRQLAHSNLPGLVRGVLDQQQVPPDRLCLEITESALMEDAATAEQALAELKAIGVDLAIDDFGTGYSSLSYLRRFPVDVVKIDRSFVDGLGPDPDDSAIVSAIVNLARTLELDCIAEGVETATQLAELRALGCRTAQGFLFAKPSPASSVRKDLSRTFSIESNAPVTKPGAG